MKFIFKLSIITLCLLWSYSSYGQTRGFIFVPGSSVLDPNGDGYVSQIPSGFSTDGYYVDEFEITMFPMSKLGQGEIDSDVGRGPDCGFTDMVPDTGGFTSYSAVDTANNFIFRFRLGNSVPNNKGYTVLIDIDNLFGPADPNYSFDNPGFEIMISLEGNTDVKVYDIDGISDCANLKRTYSGSSNHQKAVAGTNNCADPDYFYDFYVPFADLTTDFGITTSTPLFMASLTTMAPACGFHNSLSDIGGVNDDDYGNCFSCIFEELYCNQTSTPADSLCSTCSGIDLTPSCPSACPNYSVLPELGDSIIKGIAQSGAEVFIEVYDLSIPTTTYDTVIANGAGVWTVTLANPIANGDTIQINAQITGRSVSENCEFLLIDSVGCVLPQQCSEAPYNISTNSGNPTMIAILGQVNEPSGTTITIYRADSLNVYATATVAADSTWIYDCGAKDCIEGTQYYITAQASGECESLDTNFCTGGGWSATPVITTTTLYDTSSVVSGTKSGVDTVYSVRLFINGYYIDSIAGDTLTTWSLSGLTLYPGDVVTARAQRRDGNKCWSAESNAVIVLGDPVSDTSAVPIVNSPLIAGDTIVSGTSLGPPGTKIYVFKNMALIDSAITNPFGNWSITVSPPLVATDSISSTALEVCKVQSPLSAWVNVFGQSDAPSINCAALNLFEGDTIIFGTSTEAAGTEIYIYIDGDSIGSAIVDGAGNWADTVLNTALYTGGLLYTTATNLAANELESNNSDTCIVQCLLPVDSFSLSLVGALPCDSGTVSIEVSGSDNLIIYEIYDIIGDSVIGYSILGNGDSLILNTMPLDTGNYQLTVKAFKISTPACETLIQDTLSLSIYLCNEICNDSIDNDNDGLVDCADTLDCRPTQPGIITASNDTICAGVTGESYSITPVAGAISYDWTLPAGATITAGQGTTTISGDWGTSSGNVCVRSYNGFCYSLFSCTSVLVNDVPATPSPIFH